MGFENKPENVRKAMLDGNTEALRAMQAKGKSHRVQMNDFRAAEQQQQLAEQKAEIARDLEEANKLHNLSPEGDVRPPDDMIPLP